MNRLPAATLVALRDLVREAMRAQRAVIALQLGPPDDLQPAFPRSRTMRVLTRHPMLVAGAVGRILPLFPATRLAGRLLGPLVIALGVASTTRALFNKR